MELGAVDQDSVMRIAPMSTGFKLLGTFVGSDDFVYEKLDACVDNFATALTRLRSIRDNPQVAFLLLKFCVNQQLSHILRSSPPRLTKNMALRADHLVNQSLSQLLGVVHTPVPPLDAPLTEWPVAFIKCRLPGTYGGLGVTSLSAIAEAAFLGGLAACWSTLRPLFDNNLPSTTALMNDIISSIWHILNITNTNNVNVPSELESYLNSRWSALTQRLTKIFPSRESWSTLTFEEFTNVLTPQVVDKACRRMGREGKLQHLLSKTVSCQLHGISLSAISTPFNLSSACNEAMLWTSAIPTSPDMVIQPALFRILVAHALGLPLPGFLTLRNRTCSCRASLGHEGYHLLACYRTFAHDRVVRVLNDMCRTAGLVSDVEPVGMMSGERRPDLLVSNLREDGKAYLADFASVDPIRQSSIETSWFTPGVAAYEREQEKLESYHGHFDPTAFEMIPLAMETTGRMTPKFRQFLSEVATYASTHLETGGVGPHRFRARFLKFWKTKLMVTFLKSLARSAAETQQAILDRSVRNTMETRDFNMFEP
jgi:hypothetical protein